MSPDVWVVSGNMSKSNHRYHTKGDCSRLERADEESVIQKPLSVIEGHRDECKECSGEMDRYCAKSGQSTNKTREMLLNMDVEEV